MIIIKMGILFYMYVLLPFLMGMALTGSKIKRSLTGIYLQGYFVYFAWMYLILIPMVYLDLNNQMGAVCLEITDLLVGIGLMIHMRHSLQKILQYAISEAEHGLTENAGKGILVVSLLLMVISILFVTSSPADQVPEQVRTLQKAGNLGALKPSEGIFPGGFLAALYMTGSTLTGINAVTMIHYFLPVAFLPLFFSCYHEIGTRFFEESQKKNFFYEVILVFFGLLCFSYSYVGLEVFQNSWNGETILFVCIIPAVFTDLILLKKKAKWGKRRRQRVGCNLFFMALAAQCCMRGGLWYVAGMAAIGILLKYVGQEAEE